MSKQPRADLEQPLTVLRTRVWAENGLSTTEKAVLTVLVMHAVQTDRVWPSQGTIARNSGCKSRAAIYALKSLEEKGYLTRQPNPPRVTTYVLHVVHRAFNALCTPCREIPRQVQVDSASDAHEVLSEVPNEVHQIAHSPTATGAGRSKRKNTEPAPAWSRTAGELWSARMGGTAPFGQIGKALKPLVEQHGEDDVLAAWKRYLDEQDPQYLAPNNFATRYGIWASAASRYVIVDDPYDDPPAIIETEEQIRADRAASERRQQEEEARIAEREAHEDALIAEWEEANPGDARRVRSEEHDKLPDNPLKEKAFRRNYRWRVLALVRQGAAA